MVDEEARGGGRICDANKTSPNDQAWQCIHTCAATMRRQLGESEAALERNTSRHPSSQSPRGPEMPRRTSPAPARVPSTGIDHAASRKSPSHLVQYKNSMTAVPKTGSTPRGGSSPSRENIGRPFFPRALTGIPNRGAEPKSGHVRGLRGPERRDLSVGKTPLNAHARASPLSRRSAVPRSA